MSQLSPEVAILADRLDARRHHSADEPPDWVREEPGHEGPMPDALPGDLRFHSIGEVLDQLAQAPAPGFLARPVWPSDAYGIVAATMKAGKTWLISDLAVAVASGGSWLGRFPIERSGPVLLFLGEGGPRKMLRRLAAVAEHQGKVLRDQPIRLCFRVPHLTRSEHLEQMRAEIEATRPTLVVLDPLYLAARGANGSQLYEMGALLEAVQLMCQAAGAALVVVHHHNRREGSGVSRISGAGPAEWGRVLLTAEVKASRTEPVTGESSVTLDLDFLGDEIPEMRLRIRRRVRAVDPDDLGSPLIYAVDVLDREPDDDGDDDMRPAHRRVLAVLSGSGGEWLDRRQIGDKLAVDGTGLAPLKARTIQDATRFLADRGLIEAARDATGSAFRWRVGQTPGEGKNGL